MGTTFSSIQPISIRALKQSFSKGVIKAMNQNLTYDARAFLDKMLEVT
jgi:hypothetical protein